ncbi:MAG: exosortase [Alphaproteobacteria bacterium]|jgi:exosortase
MNQVAKATLCTLFIILCIFTLCTLPVAKSLVNIWINDTSFYHCFLVFPCFFVGLVLKPEIFDIYPIRFEPLTVPLIAISSALMVVTFWGGFNIIAHFLWVLTAILIVIAALGRHIVRYNWALVFFLLFAVPFGTEFIVPLQNFTAFVSVRLLEWSGVDVIYEGIHIITPKARFYVAEACAGLRFLIANIFVSYVFAYFHFQTKKSWLIFGVISLAIPIIGNCLRAYMIMMIGHYSNGEYAAGVDHLIYGWGFFSLLAFINLMIGDRLAKKEPVFETEIAPRLPFGTYDATRDKFYPFAHFYEKRIFLSVIIILLTPFTLNHYFNDIIADKAMQSAPDIKAISPINLDHKTIYKTYLMQDFKGADYQQAYLIDNATILQMSYYNYQDNHKEVSSSLHKIHNEDDRFLLSQGTKTYGNVPYTVTVNGRIDGQKYITLSTYFYENKTGVHYTNSRFDLQYNAMMNFLYYGNNDAGIIIIDKPLRHNEAPEDALKLLFN